MKLLLVIVVHLMILIGNMGLKYTRCNVPTSGQFISFSVSGCGDADYCKLKAGSNLTIEAKFQSLINVTYIRPLLRAYLFSTVEFPLYGYDGCNHAGENATLLKEQVCDCVVIADIEKGLFIPGRLPLTFRLDGYTVDSQILENLFCVKFNGRGVRK